MYYIFDEIYTDEKCSKKFKKIINCLTENKFKLGVYCIMLPTNNNNLLDIININELKFKYYQNKDNYIVGFACNKESATEVVAQLINDVLIKYGSLSFDEFLKIDKFSRI